MKIKRKEPNRCKFCSRAMRCSGESYAENPWCRKCLAYRISIAPKLPPGKWVHVGHYFQFVPYADQQGGTA